MSDARTVRLSTRADATSAEIVVLDARFQLVHRAVGSVDVALAPGAYTVQYKAGSAVTEVPVILRPDAGTVTVPPPQLRMRSPAPLAGNEAGNRYGDFARRCSRVVHGRSGEGSELFVFIRTATEEPKGSGTADSLFQATLLDAQTQVIAELASTGERAPDGAALGCNLELAPGAYLLRFTAGDLGSLEQSVVVSEGWQTQVFASSRR